MTRTRDGIERRIQTLLEAGTVGDLDDGRLLERFLTREGESSEAAFASLVERHGPMVWRACRSILADPNDADDAFQATFLVLARRSRSLWVRDSLGPWLLQIARRTSLRARSRARERRLREQASAGGRPPLVEPRPLDDLAAIHEEIARLPGRYREVVVLCLLEGLADEHAAERLGLPLGTVHSRLARGRDRLRRSLTRRGLAPAAALAALASPIESASAVVPPPLVAATVQAAAQLTAAGGRIAPLAVVLTLMEGVARMSWIAKVKMGAAVVAALGGVALAAAVGSPGPNPDSKPPAASGSRSDEPSGDSRPAAPEIIPPLDPTMAHVRLTIKPDGSDWVAPGFGTIISSTSEESIILTTGRQFAPARLVEWKPGTKFHGTVEVRLAAGRLQEGSGAIGGAVSTPDHYSAEVVDFDPWKNVALARIRPGRILPTSRVVKRGWRPESGMELVTVEMSPSDVTHTRFTKFLDASEQASPYGPSKFLTCSRTFEVGVPGSGLFLPSRPGSTTSGEIVGVYIVGGLGSQPGVYASPESLHHILDRNGLAALISDDLPAQAEAPEPARPAPTAPTPETTVETAGPIRSTVKVRIYDDARVGFNLGTIVSSSSGEAMILTCAHNLGPEGSGRGRSIRVRYPSPEMPGEGKGSDGEVEVDGELLARDLGRDLAVLRIHPGRDLPSVRVARPGRPLEVGRELFRTDGPIDGPPWLKTTTVVRTDVALSLAGRQNYRGTACEGTPLQGNSGSGLFLRSGDVARPSWEVVGVCNYAAPNENEGYYASPESIREFLEAEGLSALIPSDGTEPPSPQESAAEPASKGSDPASPVVRIGIEGTPPVAGFGVVVSSRADESIVLTAGSLFDAGEGSPRVEPGAFSRNIAVTLAASANEAYAVPAPPGSTFPGEVVDYDLARNVGLIRIRPGRALPTAVVVPRGWPVQQARALHVYKLDEEGHLADRGVRVIDPEVSGEVEGVIYKAIECERPPMRDEVGMPLDLGLVEKGKPRFLVIGVCNYSDATTGSLPRQGTGLYASVEMIHHILEKNGYAMPDPQVDAPKAMAPGRPFVRFPKSEAASRKPEPARPGSDTEDAPRLDRVERRIDAMDLKLDRILEGLNGPPAPLKPTRR